MKQVKINGQVHTFPDEATDEQIEAALQEMLGTPPGDGTAWMDDYEAPLTEGLLAQLPESAQAFILGAGKTVDKGVAGVQDLAMSAADLVPGVDYSQELADLEAQQRANQKVYQEGVAEDFPIATTLGEIAPYLATVPLSGGVGTQMAIGGGIDAMMYQPDATSRVEEGLQGALLSGLPYGIGRQARNIGSRFFPLDEINRQVARADDLGFGLTPGERMGNNFMKQVEAGIESLPMPFNPVQGRHISRQGAVNRAVGEALGEPVTRAGALSEDVLGSAAANIGEEFDTLIRGRNFRVTDSFKDAIDNINLEAKRGIFGGEDIGKVIDNIKEIAAEKDNMVSGDTIQSWRTLINEAIDQTYRSDKFAPGFRDSLESLGKQVDDMIEFNLRTSGEAGENLSQRWADAREKWTAFKRLEKSKAVNEAGDVSGAKLGSSLSTQDKWGYGRGTNRSDMYDVARLSRNPRFRPAVGDSGTATRSYMGQLVRNPIKGVMGLMGGNALSRGYMLGADLVAGTPGAADRAGRVAGRTALGYFSDDGDPVEQYEADTTDSLSTLLGVISARTGKDIAAQLADDSEINRWAFANTNRKASPGERLGAQRELEKLLTARGLKPHQANLIANELAFPERQPPDRGALYESPTFEVQ